MSSIPDDDGELDVCDACGGTGIEEGREWDGAKCTWCTGKGFVTIDREDDESPSTVKASQP